MEEKPSQLQQELKEDIQLATKIQASVKSTVQVLGNQSRYQVYLIIFLSFCFLMALYQINGGSYFFMNPIFECNGLQTSEEIACQKLQQCILVNDYTITGQIKLYCGDKKTDRNTIQSMFGVGAAIGILLNNFISDVQGRKFSLIIALLMQILSVYFLILGTYLEQVSLLIASQLFSGYGAMGLLTVAYVYCDKLMSKKWTTRTVLVTNGCSACSQMTFILFTDYSNWKVLSHFVILAPLVIVFIVGLLFLVQDPVFLVMKGRYEECRESLKYLAKINKTGQKYKQAIKFISDCDNQLLQVSNKKNSGSCLNVLKFLKVFLRPQLIIAALLLGVQSIGGSLCYFGLNYSSNITGYSFGVNMLIFGITQFAGMFPLMFFGNKVPRKLGLLIVCVLLAIICTFFYFSLSSIVQTVLMGIFRFVLVSQYALEVYLSVESFPQHIQSTAFGLIGVFGQLGKVFAPLLVRISQDLQISPIFVLSIVIAILMISPLLFIKQTLKPSKNENVSESDPLLTSSYLL